MGQKRGWSYEIWMRGCPWIEDVKLLSTGMLNAEWKDVFEEDVKFFQDNKVERWMLESEWFDVFKLKISSSSEQELDGSYEIWMRECLEVENIKILSSS